LDPHDTLFAQVTDGLDTTVVAGGASDHADSSAAGHRRWLVVHLVILTQVDLAHRNSKVAQGLEHRPQKQKSQTGCDDEIQWKQEFRAVKGFAPKPVFKQALGLA